MEKVFGKRNAVSTAQQWEDKRRDVNRFSHKAAYEWERCWWSPRRNREASV